MCLYSTFCLVLWWCICFLFFVFVIFLNKLFNFLCGALQLQCSFSLWNHFLSLYRETFISDPLNLKSSSHLWWQFTTSDCKLILNPDLKPQFICITWIPSQVKDSTYSSFTFIDLSHPSANQPVKNLILHSFKPASLKDSLELIGSLSLKRTQGNLMAEVKTASEWPGCIQHEFITKLLIGVLLKE